MNKSSRLDPIYMKVCTNWWSSLVAESQRQDVWHQEVSKIFAPLGTLIGFQGQHGSQNA